MNSAIVLCAYFAMVLSPCFVAQWGDLLSSRWIVALVRRRRTHAAESFLVSFRHERYAMAMAVQATFFASNESFATAPTPFVIIQQPVIVETPGFLDARQRVAARVAQLAVAQKLRNVTEAPQKVVAIPADAPAHRAAEAFSVEVAAHIHPRKPEHVPAQESQREAVPLVFRDLVEVAAALPGGSRNSPVEAAPVRSAQPKPGESGSLEIAA